MQEIDKSRNNYLSDFLRYHGDEMNDQERNAFERSLQQDPFAEEASEGFAETSPVLAERDISEIRKRLNRRIPVNRKHIWYRVAASVAAVMILASVFVFDFGEKPEEQIARTPESPVMKESQVMPEQTPEESGIKDQVTLISDKKVQSEAGESEGISLKKDEPVIEEAHAASREVAAIAEAQPAEPSLMAEKAKTLPTEGASGTYNQPVPVRGKIISSEDNQPLPGAIITLKGTSRGAIADTGGNFRLDVNEAADKVFIAQYVGMEAKEFMATRDSDLEIKLDPSVSLLNETVVVGYGVQKSETGNADTSDGYTPPRPLQGQAAFDRYIRENIRRPDSTTTGQRVVVILSFFIEKSGRPDSIKVIKSPGKAFSDEAIRLIREGPSWKPAEENGVTISDEVSIRIVFR